MTRIVHPLLLALPMLLGACAPSSTPAAVPAAVPPGKVQVRLTGPLVSIPGGAETVLLVYGTTLVADGPAPLMGKACLRGQLELPRTLELTYDPAVTDRGGRPTQPQNVVVGVYVGNQRIYGTGNFARIGTNRVAEDVQLVPTSGTRSSTGVESCT